MLVQYFINYNRPGVEHCFGGPGPSWVNRRDELDKWMETGTAPDQVVSYWLDEKMQPAGSRLLCAYPHVAEYDGNESWKAK